MPIYIEKKYSYKTISTGVQIFWVLFGFIITIFLSYSLSVMIVSSKELHFNSISTQLIKWGVGIIIWGYLFMGGIVTIKDNHIGVPMIFLKKVDWWFVDEGWNWVLPRPFMSYTQVKRFDSPDLSEIPLNSLLTNNHQEINYNISIYYNILNPLQYLKTLVDNANNLSPLIEIIKSEIFKHRALNNLTEIDLMTNSIDLGVLLQQKINETSLTYWGIMIKELNFKDPKTNKKGMESFISRRSEIFEKNHELEIKTLGLELKLREAIVYNATEGLNGAALASKLESIILTGLSSKEASEFLNIFEGKINKSISQKDINYGGSAGNSIIEAISILKNIFN